MITYEECKAQAEKYIRQALSAREQEKYLEILNGVYIEAYLQGFTCAGGIIEAAETAEEDMNMNKRKGTDGKNL